MTMRSSPLLITGLVAGAALALATVVSIAKQSDDGTIHVPAFDLPLSGFLSAETRAALIRQTKEMAEFQKLCPADGTTPQAVAAYRQCLDKNFYSELIAKHKARYKVSIQP